MKITEKNRINYIMGYECGDLNDTETLELFSHLIKNGMVWKLQGHYGRTANNLIDRDIIDNNGHINWDYINSLE
tara:strand:- start:562 stop:783 length:222 start_codon:yes stop_codon:yes gene_type:complete